MNKKIILGVVLVLVIGAIVYFESMKVDLGSGSGVSVSEEDTGDFPVAPELAGISGYLNSEEIKISDFRGKVVLIDFWTYTCINCIRTLPFLTEWDEKYRDKGLVIIGVHTPEFPFEEKYENVEDAIDKYDIKYAVVQDNDYATWKAYQGGRGYWPHKYLIDAEGFIRYDHIGEGAYDVTEKKIQELLGEIGEDASGDLITVEDQTPTLRQTPELYAGSAFALPRGQNVGNAGGLRVDEVFNYEMPSNVKKDIIYLDGEWMSNANDLVLESDGNIVLGFTAEAVNIVAAGSGEMEVFIGSEYVSEEFAGDDVKIEDGRSFVELDEPRLYNVFRGEHGDYLLRLEVSEEFSFNAFTFG